MALKAKRRSPVPRIFLDEIRLTGLNPDALLRKMGGKEARALLYRGAQGKIKDFITRPKRYPTLPFFIVG